MQLGWEEYLRKYRNIESLPFRCLSNVSVNKVKCREGVPEIALNPNINLQEIITEGDYA